MKKIFIILLTLLTSCSSNKTNSPSSTNDSSCQKEKGYYQLCFGECLSTTGGTTLQAISACGKSCKNAMPINCR